MTNLNTLLTKLSDIKFKTVEEMHEEYKKGVDNTFDLLKFKPHPTGIGVRATYLIGNDEDKGLLISVVGGDAFYGDGEKTFEVGICLGGSVAVAGWKTKEEVAEIIDLLKDFNH
ncbi:MAG: hypothetical protein ACPGIF_03880 [Flavobacteriales bacterium]